MKKKNSDFEKSLFDIIPTKQDLILLYKHKLVDKLDLHDSVTLASLSMYVSVLGKIKYGKDD